MAIELTPSCLLISACDDIVTDYNSRFPQSENTVAADVERAGDSRKYLTDRGQHVWRSYLASQGLTTNCRDYAPLDNDEMATLAIRMTDVNAALAKLGTCNSTKSGLDTLFSTHSSLRWRTGAAYLAFGFAILLLTYVALPQIIAYFATLKLDHHETSMLTKLSDATKALENLKINELADSHKAASTHLTRIRPYSGEHNATVKSLQGLIAPLNVIGSQLKPANSETQSSELESRLQNVINQFTTAPAKPEGQPQNPPPVEIFYAILARPKLDPSPILDALQQTQQSIFSAIQALPQNQRAGPLAQHNIAATKLQDARSLLPGNLLLLTTEEKKTLEDAAANANNATEQARQLITALNSARDSLRFLGDTAQNRLDRLMNDVTDVGTVLNDVRASLSATDNLPDLIAAQNRLNSAANSIRDTVSVMESIAFRAASPGVLLLFAIGAMFVTFGLSSLLRWVKGHEQRYTGALWAAHAEFVCNVARMMMELGIDPARVLPKIRPPAGRDEPDIRLAGNPISMTADELLRQFGVMRR